MKLSIVNKDLKKTVEFLSDIELSGKSSRARVKLNDRLSEKLTDFSVEFSKMKQTFDELKDTEQYEKLDNQIEQLNELTSEVSIVDMGEYEHLLGSLKTDLEDYPHVLKGDDAVAHDIVLDALEGNNVTQINNSVEDAQYQEVE